MPQPTPSHLHDSRFRFLAAALLLVALVQAPVAATTFHVTPVRMYLQGGDAIGVFELSNPSGQRIVLQADPTSWSQASGLDDYQPTEELLVSPPIFTLEPNGQQIVRVALREPRDVTVELAYRVFFTEVPSLREFEGAGVQFALRIAVPVFFRDHEPAAPPRLDLAVEEAETGWTVRASNLDRLHTRLHSWQLLGDGGELIASSQSPVYVLAASSRNLPVPKAELSADNAELGETVASVLAQGALRVVLTTERGVVEQAVMAPARLATAQPSERSPTSTNP